MTPLRGSGHVRCLAGLGVALLVCVACRGEEANSQSIDASSVARIQVEENIRFAFLCLFIISNYIRGLPIQDRQQGTGNSGQGTGERGQGTGDMVQGTVDR